jgi:hypothetical protein
MFFCGLAGENKEVFSWNVILSGHCCNLKRAEGVCMTGSVDTDWPAPLHDDSKNRNNLIKEKSV